MLRIWTVSRLAVFSLFAFLLALSPAVAQKNASTGRVKVHVSPKQAYVFVDNSAIRDGSQTIPLSPGKHAIGVYNYGYIPQTQMVDVAAGKTTDLSVSLKQSGDKVDGPFGDIELKGHPRAAVLLNGTTPTYFVGHVDEFDNNFIWHQWLLVKPGTYPVTVTQKGQTIWSGPVDVKAGQRVVVNVNHNGSIKTREFKRGLTIGPEPRFGAGLASAVGAIAPVTTQFSASQGNIACGGAAMLNWKSADAADTSISNVGSVAATGSREVSPTQNTTYVLTAKGPGGVATQSATVNVNGTPTASLTLSQPEIRYHRIGDKVVEQDSATLQWSAGNASRVTINPLGDVAASGSETVYAIPGAVTSGPINREVTYTLDVSNECGGVVRRTAAVHITGSIDSPPSITLASLFYPTNYPERRNPEVGLLSSQEQTLAKAAATFKNNEQYDEQNKLTVIGHADRRGSAKFNLALSQRRGDLVKNFLIAQGIPADKIEVRAEGKDHPLDAKSIQDLQSKDSEQPQKWETARKQDMQLAYNRRVDIVLEPSGQQSTEAYPNTAPDARTLWQRTAPTLKVVESASKFSPSENVQLSSLNK